MQKYINGLLCRIYYLTICLNFKNSLFLGCSATKLWLLVRHGTRNPGEDDILEMQTRGVEIQQNIVKNHEEGRGKSEP